jgi:glycosyltransferase involved in cell wall biosynthesis
VRYIPNYYFVDEYEKADPLDHSRIFRLAMIGAVPQRKGYLRALELLALLRSIDRRFTLSVLGNQPKDFPWVANDPLEQAYFSSCEDFVRRGDLESAVEHRGWTNTITASREFGFVLSLSEHEGSHVGPGEAFCAGNQGVFLPWRGVEYVYPESAVFPDVSSMAEYILAMRDPSAFNGAALSGQQYMRENYDVTLFVSRVHALLRSLG